MEFEENTTKSIAIDPVLLGQRLEAARKSKGMLQEEAATKFGCSRPTFIAIEKGKRSVTDDELSRLAAIYECDVEILKGPEQVVSEVISKSTWENAEKRGLAAKDLEQATDSYQKFVDAYSRMDKLNGTSVRKNFPPERSITRRKFSETLAETLALQERNHLGFGEQPVDDLRNFLEMEVGIRSLYDDLPTMMAGLFAFQDKTGGVVLVNRNQRPEKCLWTLVRCYGCMIHDRYRPGIAYTTPPEKPDGKERFAERFAACFLMPTAGVLRHYYNIFEGNNDFLVADLLQMARSFHVLPEKMAGRLWDLRLINRDVIDQIGAVQESDSDGLLRKQENSRFSNRYMALAIRSWQNGKLDAARLADVLRTSSGEAQRIVDDWILQERNKLSCKLPNSFIPLGTLSDIIKDK